MSKKRKGRLPPFIPVIRTTWDSPAWKQLSYGARCLYIVLRSYLRHDSLNNGKVFRSYREAATDLGTKSTRSVQRWFRELDHYAFIVMTTGGCLGVDGGGIAPHWRITECPTFDAKGNQIAATPRLRALGRYTVRRPRKNKIPYPKGTHPVSQRDTYCRSKTGSKAAEVYPK